MTGPEIDALIVKLAGVLDRIAADMRAEGIHVGLGEPPVCPTCRKPWPCPIELQKRRPIVDTAPL